MLTKIYRLLRHTFAKTSRVPRRYVDAAERRAWLERRDEQKTKDFAQRTAGVAGAQARFWS